MTSESPPEAPTVSNGATPTLRHREPLSSFEKESKAAATQQKQQVGDSEDRETVEQEDPMQSHRQRSTLGHATNSTASSAGRPPARIIYAARSKSHVSDAASVTSPSSVQSPPSVNYEEREKDREWVEQFWRTYDDIIFISLFTQLGMVFRIAAANWLAYFDDTFRHDSALFINLPLNCTSALILGFLCDGQSLMQVIETRFTPPKLRHDMRAGSDHSNATNHGRSLSRRSSMSSDATPPVPILDAPNLRQRFPWRFRRGQRDRLSAASREAGQWTSYGRVGDPELREVQLQAYERRIRASSCLVLFPVKKEDVDVMEHYFNDGYQRRGRHNDDDDMGDLELQRQGDPSSLLSRSRSTTSIGMNVHRSLAVRSPVSDEGDEAHVEWSELGSPSDGSVNNGPSQPNAHRATSPNNGVGQSSTAQAQHVDYPTQVDRDLDQILQEVSTNITTNIQDATTNLTTNLSRFQRVSLADGWDRGTAAKEMSEDLLLGLRQGFCGALSTFSSWNSSMVALMENGAVSDAIVGYAIGLQLPIVSYRFGQHIAVYYFIWRCRRENRTDAKRGYGIRVSTNEHSLDVPDDDGEHGDADDREIGSPVRPNASIRSDPKNSELPSMRAIATALFVMSIVTQLSAIFFFTDPDQRQLAVSLLFSPLGVLTRWRISRWNRLIPGFPVGTFASNMLSCALNGSFGRLLAGNPRPQERVVLQGLVSGFAGSLSSASTLVVEILNGVDPVLFRFDGFTYAICTIFWGVIIGFLTSASVNWADTAAIPDATSAPSITPTVAPTVS